MKRLFLILFILCAASGSASAAEPNYRYQAKPIGWNMAGGDLEVVFIVCKDGKALERTTFRFSSSSRWKPLLVSLMEKRDLEFSYFEVTTDMEITASPMKVLPSSGVDIVTKDTVNDMANYLNRINVAERGNSTLIFDTQIHSLKTITQNEYLNVNPRIIAVPVDAK